MDFATLAVAQNYVDKTAQSLGAVKGAPCTIKSITEDEDGSTIVFSWTGADGTEQTRSTFLPRGPQGEPGAKGDPGEPGKDGKDGAPGKDGSGIDTEARKRIAELSEEIANKKGLTSAQITALDNMFKVCAYTSSANSAYAAFCAAFGITGGDTTEGSVTYKPELDGVLSAVTNEIIPSADYWFFRTDYIPLAGYSRIKASYKLNGSGYGVAFFDDGKNIMEDVSVIGADANNYNVVEMDAPVGAAYCMLGHYGGVKPQEPDVADAYITLYGEGA